MGHQHNHNHIESAFKVAIVLTAIFFIVEIIGGIMSGSLALLGDAGHMFRDVFALFLSLSAIKLAKREPTKTKTFGYHRVKIFAAFINGLLLLVISAWIFIEAYTRISAPQPIESTTMLVVAIIGLIVNLYAMKKLHGHDDLNVKSAFLHVLTDTLSSVAVIGAAIWIYFTNQTIVDPILSIAIALFIFASSLNIIKESIKVLLEFTPANINFDDVIKDMETVKGVEGVHHVHLWSLDSNINVIDAHVYTNESEWCKIEDIKKELRERLNKYHIKHATFEFECEECEDNCKIQGVSK